MLRKGKIGNTYNNGHDASVDEKLMWVLYAVYEGEVLRTSTDEAEIIYVTKDLSEATEHANKHKGVIYAYDVTQQEDCVNETFVYDGTKA